MFKVFCFLIILVVSENSFAENLNLDKIELSIDNCLEIAGRESSKALLNKLDLKDTDLNLIRGWFAYLPAVSYETEFVNSYIDVGKEDEYLLPAKYKPNENTLSTSNNVVQKLKFRQRVFDTYMIDWIEDTINLKTAKDIVKINFKYSINYLIRCLYYELLVLQEKKNYYTTLLAYYNKLEQKGTGIPGLLTVDNKITKLYLEMEALNIDENYRNDILTLLSTLKLPLDKEVTLTSTLPEFKFNLKNDYETALNNNAFLKQLELDLGNARTEYAKQFLSFVPELSLKGSLNINDRFMTGIDFTWQGKNVKADLLGEYLIFDYNKSYYVNRFTDVKATSEFFKNNDYNIKDYNMTLLVKLDLDKLAYASIDLEKIRNTTKRNNIYVQRKKDGLRAQLEKQMINVLKMDKNTEIYDAEIQFIKQKKEFLERDDIPGNIDKVSYFEGVNNNIVYYSDQFYNNKINKYRSYALYIQLLEGGTGYKVNDSLDN